MEDSAVEVATARDPALRFSGFSDGWISKNLGQVAELTSSKRVYLSDYVPQGVPFYRGKEITDLKEGRTPEDILFITEEAYESYKAKYGVPRAGDILITAVGTLANIYRVDGGHEFYFKDGNLIWLRKVTCSSEFLEVLLDVKRDDIERTSIGSSQRALTMVELRKLALPFPTLPEQQKIAAFLGAVDRKIQQLKRKQELLERYKKGVVQKIFPSAGSGQAPELRFKRKDGSDYPEWEEKRLGDIAYITTGTSNRVDSSLDAQYTFFDRSVDVRRSSIYLYDTEAIIVGGEGQEFVPKHYKGKFDLHQRAYAIMNFKGVTGPFLFQYIDKHRAYFLSQAVGSTVKSLRLPMFTGMPILLPSLEEQSRIAGFLMALDAKVAGVAQAVAAAQRWKKGLLQQMFV